MAAQVEGCAARLLEGDLCNDWLRSLLVSSWW